MNLFLPDRRSIEFGWRFSFARSLIIIEQ